MQTYFISNDYILKFGNIFVFKNLVHRLMIHKFRLKTPQMYKEWFNRLYLKIRSIDDHLSRKIGPADSKDNLLNPIDQQVHWSIR